LIEKVKQHQGKVWARKKGNYEQKWIDEGNQSKYKEGDIVRKISAQPDKYDTQWSVTLYEIAKVTKPRNPVKPVTYRLKKRGAASFIDGTFTSLELQRVPLNDQRQAQESGIPADMLNLDDEANREYVPLRIYEERMKKGGRELLVRWRGFSMREASWVPEQQVAGSVALRKWDKDRATPAEVKVAASLAALL
jgi:hypothetical protein